MDLELVEGALATVVALCTYYYGKHKGSQAAENAVYKPPKPECGCGHHYSMHDPETGVCGAGGKPILLERGDPTNVLKSNDPYHGPRYTTVYGHEKWEPTVCGCKRYVGPEPLNSITEGF